MSFTRTFCVALCFFGPLSRALLVSIWRGAECRYTTLLGWTVKWRMQLLKSRRRWQVYGLRCVYWWLFVCYLTWHDYPTLVGEKVMVYYYYYFQRTLVLQINMHGIKSNMSYWQYVFDLKMGIFACWHPVFFAILKEL